jgi:DNA-binding NarL/FixJ family response regulator
MIRLLVVDDNAMLRSGVAAMVRASPSVSLIGEAADGEAAISSFVRLQPDVVLMDLQMPRLDGVGAVKALRTLDPTARIIIMSTYASDQIVADALRAGAAGYLAKSALRRNLVNAVLTVHSGQKYIHPDASEDREP